MPHSPFTRLLGLFIVAAYALALLWPDERAHLWGWQGLATAPILFGIFTWWAVRGAPPRDDRAFHRTLPPGDGFAFRRVLMIHLAVLAGIALVVVIYGSWFNLGWQVISYGIAVLTLPVWAWMAAFAIGASLASSRQDWRSSGFLAVLAVPALSAAWMCWVRRDFVPEEKISVYFPPLRTIVLACGLLYPLIWWLVAVRHRRKLGIFFGAATSALIPWLYVYGDFVPYEREMHDAPVREGITFVRHSPSGIVELPDDHRIVPFRQISVSGLGPDEFVRVHWIQMGGENHHLAEIREPYDRKLGGLVSFGSQFAADESGRVISGWEAMRRSIERELGPDGNFQGWSAADGGPVASVILARDESGHMRMPDEFEQALTVPGVESKPWSFQGSVYQWVNVLEVAAMKGGRAYLPDGGVIELRSLFGRSGDPSLGLRIYRKCFDQFDGSWWGTEEDDGIYIPAPAVVAVDPSGHARFIPYGLAPKSGKNFLMQWQELSYVGISMGPDYAAELERLKNSRLYVFWPKFQGTITADLPVPE